MKNCLVIDSKYYNFILSIFSCKSRSTSSINWFVYKEKMFNKNKQARSYVKITYTKLQSFKK